MKVMGVDACIEVHGVQISKEELRRASGDLAECIGFDQFWIKPDQDQHCLETTEEGNIRLNTFWRYYGPGYERGPWMNIRYTLLWLIKKFMGARVYYWGDNSGIPVEQPVTLSFLDEMDSYFLSRGHVPYQTFFNPKGEMPQCSFCVRPMVNHGGGANRELLQCHGCGRKWISMTGQLYELSKDEDFFAGLKRVQKNFA